MERKTSLALLNPCITCTLCKGYLIDATTISECLHTFCRTCIVNFLQINTYCPVCNQVIHQSHPLSYIGHDRTMQDIVYKLVPGLQENERQRQIEFYQSRGLDIPLALMGSDVSGGESQASDTASTASTATNDDSGPSAAKRARESPRGSPRASPRPSPGDSPASTPAPTFKDPEPPKRAEEQMNLCLVAQDLDPDDPQRKRFIRCSSQATVTHIKKYISLKINGSIDKYREIEVLCNNETMGKDHTLKFITVTRWRGKKAPLVLDHRILIDPDLS